MNVVLKVRADGATGAIFTVSTIIGQKSNLSDKTEQYLTAIIMQDAKSLNEVTFSGKENLQAIIKGLEKQGIVLHGDVQTLKCQKINYSNKNGKVIEAAVFLAQIGTEQYTVDVTYEKRDGNEGLTTVIINRSENTNQSGDGSPIDN